MKRDVGTRVSWCWAFGPNDESEWKRKLKLASLCAYFLLPRLLSCYGNWDRRWKGEQALKQRREISEFVRHPMVTMILPAGLVETRKPKSREAVCWLPNQWVAAMGLQCRPYFPARGEGL